MIDSQSKATCRIKKEQFPWNKKNQDQNNQIVIELYIEPVFFMYPSSLDSNDVVSQWRK